jgi:hypothetical protein
LIDLLDDDSQEIAVRDYNIPPDVAQLEQVQKRVRKLKSTVLRIANAKQVSNDAITRLQNEMRETSIITRQQLADAQTKIGQLENAKLQQNTTITQLEKRVIALKAENARFPVSELQQANVE